MDIAPDLTLLDSESKPVTLSSFWKKAPTLFVFYPGDFTPVCTKQLCDYRDQYQVFRDMGLQLVGISADSPQKHVEFAQAKSLPFPLLSDPKNEAVKALGCTSKWSLGLLPNRSLCLVGTDGRVLWRQIEAVAITHQTSEQVVAALKDVLPRT